MSLFVLCVQQEALLRLELLWETRPGQKILVLVGCSGGEGGCNAQPLPPPNLVVNTRNQPMGHELLCLSILYDIRVRADGCAVLSLLRKTGKGAPASHRAALRIT